MLRRANAQQALLLFGEAASFPPCGTLPSTWARRGQHPTIQTSGQRQGYKGFGVLDDFTGCRFDQGQAGRLHSAAYMAFLRRVLEHTTQPSILSQDGAKEHPSSETNAFFAQQTARLQVFPWPP
jgi:DDE superfamily endonuclease